MRAPLVPPILALATPAYVFPITVLITLRLGQTENLVTLERTPPLMGQGKQNMPSPLPLQEEVTPDEQQIIK